MISYLHGHRDGSSTIWDKIKPGYHMCIAPLKLDQIMKQNICRHRRRRDDTLVWPFSILWSILSIPFISPPPTSPTGCSSSMVDYIPAYHPLPVVPQDVAAAWWIIFQHIKGIIHLDISLSYWEDLILHSCLVMTVISYFGGLFPGRSISVCVCACV